MISCKEFIETYCMVRNQKGKLEPITLNPKQITMLGIMEKDPRGSILTKRRVGKSTAMLCHACYLALQGKTSVILVPYVSLVKDFKRALEEIMPGASNNKHIILTTDIETIKGCTFDHIYIDEVTLVKPDNIKWEEILPCTSKNFKMTLLTSIEHPDCYKDFNHQYI